MIIMIIRMILMVTHTIIMIGFGYANYYATKN